MSDWYSLRITMSREEANKLEALAAHHKCSCPEVIRRFLRSAQPGGSGWVDPYTAAVNHAAKKAKNDETL